MVFVAMTHVTLALDAIDGRHDDVGSDIGMMPRRRYEYGIEYEYQNKNPA